MKGHGPSLHGFHGLVQALTPALEACRLDAVMPYETYKVIHILGVIFLFTALGGLLLHLMNGGNKADNPSRKVLAITHGIALLVIFVAGFGLLARIQPMSAGIPIWLYPKLLIWLFMGIAVALLYRKPRLAASFWWVLPLLGVLAAVFAIYKPL